MHSTTIPGLSLVTLLLAIVLPVGSTYASSEQADAVGQWLSDRAMRAAEKDEAQGAARSLEEGVYRLIPLAELDAPEPVKEYFREQFQRSRSGVVRVPKGTIPSQQALIMALPKVWRSDAILRQRLPNPPSDLQKTLLGAAETIGMEPTGTIEGLKSSGLSRFYRVNDIGIVEFNEKNFRVPGGVIEAFVEAQNTDINGTPGQIEMEVDGQGRSRATLVWAGKDKVYTLTATGDGDVERKAIVLQQIAAAVRD
ncbi:hypothetical protein [Stenotrophomonas sp. PS02300]|jgi:hypothetical protein|uniref:hypothetical protein n=1 Tax=Stenotrophomonas sp. PS02300 TaxID=2991426 RepID=UPI00249B3D95|nr:hypothetical protein [Stenotrophomonas sp. PS02300]